MNVALLAAGGFSLPLAFWVIARWFGGTTLYPRSRNLVEPEPDHRPFESVDFCARDGVRLHGRWFEHPDAKGVMLICHGNAGNVSHRMWMAEDLRDVPLHLFLFDYRGYGQSRGRPSEKGTALDVEAAWEVAFQRLGRPDHPPILLYGRSLGGAVALQLPQTCPVRGVVLESSFTSIIELAKQYYPWLLPEWTLANRYESERRIRQLEVPTLIAHSPDDELVPYTMGQRLHQASPHAWDFCTLTGGHEEAGWQTSADYAATIRRFMRDVGVLPSSGDVLTKPEI